MLTIQIEDAQLEQRILEKAKNIGKSAQQFIKELVTESLDDTDELGFDIPHKDYRKYSSVIHNELSEEDELELVNNPSIRPFSHI